MAKKMFKDITEKLESLKKITFKDLIEKVDSPYSWVYLDHEIFVVNNENGVLERFKPSHSAFIQKRFIKGDQYILFAGSHAFIIYKEDYDKTSIVLKFGNSIQYHLFLNELEAQRYRSSVLMGIIEKLTNEIAALEYVDNGEFNPSMEYEER